MTIEGTETIMWTRHRSRRTTARSRRHLSLLLTIGLLAPLGTLTLGVAAAEAACSGSACTGADPEAADCGNHQAIVGSRTDKSDGYATEVISLKFSTDCHSWWTRFSITAPGFAPCDVASYEGVRGYINAQILPPSGLWTNFYSAPSKMHSCPKAADKSAGVGWTPMSRGGSDIRAQACIQRKQSNGSWKTTLCTGWFTRS